MIKDINPYRYRSCIHPAILGGIIAGGASLLGGGISSIFGSRSQSKSNATNLKIARETNEANRQLAMYQNDMNLAQWNRENEYNHPIQQMARLQAAGINPNLAYSNGAGANVAAKSPDLVTSRDQPAHVNPINYGDFGLSQAGMNFMQGMNIVQSIEQSKAATENLGAQKDYTDAKAFEAMMNAIGQAKNNGVFDQRFSMEMSEALLRQANMSKDLDVKDQNIRESYQRMEESSARIDRIAVQNHVDKQMLKAKISEIATHIALMSEQTRGLKLSNDLDTETYQIRYQNAVDAGSKIAEDLLNSARDGRIKEQTIKRIAEDRFRAWYPHASNPLKHLFYQSAIETAKASGLTIDY